MTHDWPLTAKEVGGIPFLPPPAAVRATTSLRAALARAHDRMGLPMQVLLERLFGALDAPALYALVDLGVPDHLDRPRTAKDLAERVGVEPEPLERLLAFLASRGCVRRDRRGRYRANRVTKLLTSDGDWAGWVRFAGAPWTMAAYAQMEAAVRSNADPVAVAHGVDFFAYLAGHADASHAFHDAQAAGARLQAVTAAGALPLDGVQSVLDVGGGTGTFVAHLLASHPQLTGAVLDLPEAEDGARATFKVADVEARAEFVAGDFFRSVPGGHDLHVLTAVIHDWNDDACVQILRNCAAALNPGGRICVLESELRPGAPFSFAQSTDALMLAFTPGGRERTKTEFDTLWRRAGLSVVARTALPSPGTLFTLSAGVRA